MKRVYMAAILLLIIAIISLIFCPLRSGCSIFCPVLPCSLDHTSPVLTITFAYSTEKAGWINDALNEFNRGYHRLKSGKCIHVDSATVHGSVDMVQQILHAKDDEQPVAWSPASFLEIGLLNTEWSQQHQGQNLVDLADAQSLVSSPLVFAIWQDRANALHHKYNTINWSTLSSAFKDGWVTIGQHGWGQDVKLGQTEPDLSNSGLLTIALMAYAYFQKDSGLTVNNIHDANFIKFFQNIEDKVYCFGPSSDPLVKQLIRQGPAQYDVTAIYENLILQNEEEAVSRWGTNEPLRIVYPPKNIVSDHPFTILQGPWVTQEKREAAVDFRDFLLDVDMQKLALKYGFHPTNKEVPTNTNIDGNLFSSFPYKSDLQSYKDIQLVQPPSGLVVKALIDLWNENYGQGKACQY